MRQRSETRRRREDGKTSWEIRGCGMCGKGVGGWVGELEISHENKRTRILNNSSTANRTGGGVSPRCRRKEEEAEALLLRGERVGWLVGCTRAASGRGRASAATRTFSHEQTKRTDGRTRNDPRARRKQGTDRRKGWACVRLWVRGRGRGQGRRASSSKSRTVYRYSAIGDRVGVRWVGWGEGLDGRMRAGAR